MIALQNALTEPFQVHFGLFFVIKCKFTCRLVLSNFILVIFDRHEEGTIIGLSESHLRFQIGSPSPITVTPGSLPLILSPWVPHLHESDRSLCCVHLISSNQRVGVIGHQALGVVLSLIIFRADSASHNILIVISLFDNVPELIC